MREVQPVGPYAILGYSFGGNLAVEVARQLIANDQAVEFVTVLDAYAPGALRVRRGLSKLNAHLKIMRRQKFHETYTYICGSIHRRLFRRSQNLLAADLAPPVAETEIERRIAEVSEHCTRALDAHRPGIYSGRITLVRATNLGDWMELAEPSGTGGWDSICNGGVDVIPIACGHLDMFNEPHVTELAKHVNDLLNAIDGRRAITSLPLAERMSRSTQTKFDPFRR
jgi:thioesterase domain-containing protein